MTQVWLYRGADGLDPNPYKLFMPDEVALSFKPGETIALYLNGDDWTILRVMRVTKIFKRTGTNPFGESAGIDRVCLSVLPDYAFDPDNKFCEPREGWKDRLWPNQPVNE